MRRTPQALHKGRFVISGAGHSCSGDLVTEAKAAVVLAIPEFSPHGITAGIARKMRFRQIEIKCRHLPGGRIGSKDRLQIPGTAQRGTIRRGRYRTGHDHRIGSFLFRLFRRGLAGDKQGKTGGSNEFHDGVFLFKSENYANNGGQTLGN